MPLHTHTFHALGAMDESALPGQPVSEQLACEGAKFHSPSPLLVHQVTLPDGRMVILCGTCRDNLSALQALLIVDPELSWEVRREFGNRLRALAPSPGGTDG